MGTSTSHVAPRQGIRMGPLAQDPPMWRSPPPSGEDQRAGRPHRMDRLNGALAISLQGQLYG